MRMNRFVLHESGQERSGLDSTENSYDDLLDHLRIMVRKRRITDFASQESVNRLRAQTALKKAKPCPQNANTIVL